MGRCRAHRKTNYKRKIEIDRNFISALKNNLPDCAGVAIGLDRLLMVMSKTSEIKQTLTFPNG